MRYLIFCLLLVGCGSDPLPETKCHKALTRFYNEGCEVYKADLLIDIPLDFEDALEECYQLPDTQPCADWVECMLWACTELGCDICDRYRDECEKDLTN